MDRARNSIKNILFGLTGQILNILASFAARTVLINVLGDAYAGVNGTFTNILMVFSLADLGVGTAIIFSLYKPIAQDDTPTIRSLMALYARAYRIIGFVILGLGAALTPFVPLFFKGDSGVEHLYLIFVLYVINTASTYFFSYKGSLISANQKNYIVTNVVYLTSVIGYGLQIAALLLLRNFVVMTSIQLVINVLQNVITMRIADRMYPYLREKNYAPLPEAERKKIFKNMSSTVFYRVGQVVINGTDSILVSSFFGSIQAGIYSHYLLILTTVKNLLLMFFRAITASIGNLNASESAERQRRAYHMIYFGNFWLFGFSAVCFYVLLDPFITLWIGKSHLLPYSTVLLLVVNFYMTGMRNVNTTFRETMGIFREGRYVPMIAAVINVVASILLALFIGLDGVFWGTLVSTVTSLLWLEPKILFEYGLKISLREYFLKYALYFLATVVAGGLTAFLCNLLLPGVRLLSFIGRMFLCLLIPNALFYLLFRRTPECKLLTDTVFGVIRRKLSRVANGEE